MNNITDHGEFDYLTPNPSEVDHAIAREIRRSLSLVPDSRKPDTLSQQMAKNGLSVHSDPFAWLRS